MTQHTGLIERLRYEPTASQYLSLADLIASLHEDRKNAANALEAQAREIAELKAQLEATAKNAFEAMPHDIPRRMKDAICEETGWSGSMVSRMYTELRKAFTGEPYKANEDLDAALLEVEALKAQESELCTLYGLAEAECKRLRADAERFLALERIVHWEQERDMGPGGRYWMAVHVSSGNPTLREAIDAMKGQP